MRLLTLCSAFLLVTLLPCASATAADPAQSSRKASHKQDQKVIQDLEATWIKSLLAHDAATLEPIIADDFMGISSNGTLSNKEQYLDRIRKGKVHANNIHIEEQKIRIMNGLAIVTTLSHVNGVQDGAPMEGMYRYTRVYRHTSSGWKAVNFEATRVSGPVQTNEMSGGVPIKKEIPQKKN